MEEEMHEPNFIFSSLQYTAPQQSKPKN